jgi:hypothetical protein
VQLLAWTGVQQVQNSLSAAPAVGHIGVWVSKHPPVAIISKRPEVEQLLLVLPQAGRRLQVSQGLPAVRPTSKLPARVMQGDPVVDVGKDSGSHTVVGAIEVPVMDRTFDDRLWQGSIPAQRYRTVQPGMSGTERDGRVTVVTPIIKP